MRNSVVKVAEGVCWVGVMGWSRRLFDSHVAFGFYDEGVADVASLAREYFGAIMMPFHKMGVRAIEKIESLPIKVIASGHGPICRSPRRTIDLYKGWLAVETGKKTMIMFGSMWAPVVRGVEIISNELLSEGVDLRVFDVARSDLADIVGKIVDPRAIVAGVSTFLGGFYPLSEVAAHLTKSLRPPIRYGAIGSYGLGSGAALKAKEFPEFAGIEVVVSVEFRRALREEVVRGLEEAGKLLAEKIRGIKMPVTEILKEEHETIKVVLDVLDAICRRLESGEGIDVGDFGEIIEFIKTFADKCHHGKEEDVLFPAMEKMGIPKEGGPIGIMLMEHEMGRSFVRGLSEGLEDYVRGERGAVDKILVNARGYINLLREHINKEDNILFLMAESVLPAGVQGELIEEFERIEEDGKPVVGGDIFRKFFSYHFVEVER